jgi:parallel beta-helix repeat protein
MKILKLFGIALVTWGIKAQTTNYPSGIDNDTSLFVTADNIQTTLNTAMQTADTVAVVKSAAGFKANMIATVCDTVSGSQCTKWEHMFVTSVSGNSVTVTRGFGGTTAATHAAGKTMAILIDSAHQKVLKDAVIAIENALGPNLSKIPAAYPVVSSSSYVFTPQSCSSGAMCITGGASGMNLVSGNNTLTMQPVPPGVNGTDKTHYLYVSGGTGTAEACLITGGSGTSGQGAGQIIINCANAHSGGWTIQTATCGIQEALQTVATGGGGQVAAPVGVCLLYAGVRVFSNSTLMGAGRGGTILRIAPNALVAGNVWLLNPAHPGIYSQVIFDTVSHSTVRSLTVDMNGANQGAIASYGIEAGDSSYITINDVEVLSNTSVGGWRIGFIGPPATNFQNQVTNSIMIGTGTGSTCGGGIFVQGKQQLVQGNFASSLCDDAFVANDLPTQNILFDSNTVVSSTGPVGFHSESSSHVRFMNNTCNAGFTFCYSVDDPGTANNLVQNVEFIGNTAMGSTNAGIAINRAISATSAVVRNVIVANNRVTGSQRSGILAYDNAAGITISGNTITSNLLYGIEIQAGVYATGVAVILEQVTIAGNVIRNNGQTGNNAAGIFSSSASSANPVQKMLITANNIYDDRAGAARTQAYGIYFQNSPQSDIAIRGNTIYNHSIANIGTNFASFDLIPGMTIAGNATNDVYNMAEYTYGTTYGTLGTAVDGTVRRCRDCQMANPCAGGGTGAFAKRLNGQWVCN